MGAPNIQQQLYLKTALNESKEGMFDHPSELGEGYHKKAMRLIRAGDFERGAEVGDRAEASGLMRGGASKRTMKQHFNKKDYAVGARAQARFDKAAAKKREAALKAKGLAEEQLGEGKFNRAKRLLTRGTYERALAANAVMQRQDAREMMRGGASPSAVKRYFNNGQSSAAQSAQHRFIMSGIKKRREALKAKGLAEALEQKLEEGSRGLARHERIVKALTKKASNLFGKTRGLNPLNSEHAKTLAAVHNEPGRGERMAKYSRLARGQQTRDRVQISRERSRAGLKPQIPSASVNMTSVDKTGTTRTKSEPVSQHPELYKKFKGTAHAPARVPKAVLKYRETSKAKKSAALKAKGK